jgi:hypothetical protein
MVFDGVFQEVEPEEGELGEDTTLVRDAGTEDIVEGGDAVGGDEEELVLVERVDVAYLAAGSERETAEIGLEKRLVHLDDGTTLSAVMLTVV